MFACLHGHGNLTALAFEFSPTVEQTAPDTVTLDAGGLDRLFGLPQDVAAAIARRAAEAGVKANLALAANPDAAICAARGFRGVSIIPQGDEAKFLGTLPLTLLAPSPELQETLERWGIRRFQELAALPPLGIAERLGPEGLRLRELARGEAERKLLPLEEPLAFRRRNRAGISGGAAGAAGVPAGAAAERPGDAAGHARAGHQRTAPAAEARKPRDA